MKERGETDFDGEVWLKEREEALFVWVDRIMRILPQVSWNRLGDVRAEA